MEVSQEIRGNVVVVSPAGVLDAATGPELKAAFAAALTHSARLVADLSKLEYVSSAGLRVFVDAVKQARRQEGGDLRLAGPTPRVNQVLELSGFNRLFKMFPDTTAAVESFA